MKVSEYVFVLNGLGREQSLVARSLWSNLLTSAGINGMTSIYSTVTPSRFNIIKFVMFVKITKTPTVCILL